MKHSFKRLISLFLSAALLLALLPTVTATAAAGSVTLDFNGTDFSTALNGNGLIASASAVSAVTDTSSVPTGFTDGVYAGGDANYAASAVGFSHPVDLSKITSVKLRFYIKDYSYSGSPDLRVIDTSENPSSGYYSLGLPTFGEWNEVELIDALNSSSIRKNADGYLERFVIGFRTRAVTTVWFDSLTITYTDDFYIGSEEEDDVGTSVFDFNGSDFATDYTSGSTFGSSAKATGVNDTASVPAGFTGGVYAGGDTAYGAVAIDFAAPLDLSKITSFKIRLYVPSYSYSSAPVVRLFNEASTSGGYTSNAFVADRGGNFDRWCEIELLDLLQSNTIRKDANGHLDSFIFTIRCYASSGFVCYFDSVIIQHTDGFMVEQEEDPSKITLTYAGGGSQNHESRYLLYFDGLKNTADIYWNNNTVYVDGEARSGEGVNYVPLNGQLGLCLKYEHLESGATLVSDLKQPHILHIRAGTPLGNDGQYTIANDVWLRLDGTSITELKPIELTYASGAAQDTENRYLVRFDGITDTADIYWSNNTVYVDGEAKSGDGVNYVPLSGQLALCLKYTHLVDGAVSAVSLGKHEVVIPMGTVLGGKYVLNRTVAFTTHNYEVSSATVYDPAITVTLSNDLTRNGAATNCGFYFKTSPVDALAYDLQSWKVRYKMVSGAVYVNGAPVDSAELIKLQENLYYVAFDTYLSGGKTFADGDVVTVSGIAGTAEYAVSFETASFVYDSENGWSITDYHMPSEDVLFDLSVGAYEVTLDEMTVDGVPYAKGENLSTVGVHTVTYTRLGHTYTFTLTLYLQGDANASGQVDTLDVVALKRALSEAAELSDLGVLSADIDKDGILSRHDLSLYRKLRLGVPVLPLTPSPDQMVANASDAVAALADNYDPTAFETDTLRTGDDLYHRDIVRLSWSSAATAHTVKVSVSPAMTDAITYTVDGCSLGLINLLPNTHYYWTVSDGINTSAVQQFVTADTVRTLTINGASNTRDIGGYEANGGRVKYGMIFRGSNIDGITATGKQQLLALEVKTDLDLRGDNGGSPLGDGVRYYGYSFPYYWGGSTGLLADSYRDALVAAIRTFANEENYPIYIHCAIGRDRTGNLAMLINGLLGVAVEDLYFDYELSFLSSSGTGDDATTAHMVGHSFAGTINGIQSYAPDGSFADACEAFMLSIGITQTEIDTIRSLMIQPIP